MTQLTKELKALFTRDLIKLKDEIALYRDDDALWSVKEGISNSGGNLCLHLIGNLRTYIGKTLGGVYYERDRPNEFSAKLIPRVNIYREIDETIEAVTLSLDIISADQLAEDFPEMIWGKPTGMIYTLMHLHGHLTYHLGQINYHRRLLDSPHRSMNKYS